MRTYIFILLVGLLLSSVLFPQTPQDSPELKEANDLSVSVANLFKEEKFDAAIPLAKRALEIRERLLLPADPLVSKSLTNLGDLYIAKGDNKAAKKIFERLLALQEQQFGPADVKLGPTLDRLAALYYRDGGTDKAEDLYQRAVTVRENALGPNHVEVADSLFALGQYYRLRRKYDLAQTAYRHSLMIYGRESGVKTPAFERASIGMRCLAYESRMFDAGKELEAIQKQFAPPGEPPKLKGILNGTSLSMPRPEYPMGVNGPRAAGTVTVFVEINEEGKVTSARDVCYGPPDLTAASIKAALKARFVPTILDGKPVKVTGFIQYNFVAPDRRFP